MKGKPEHLPDNVWDAASFFLERKVILITKEHKYLKRLINASELEKTWRHIDKLLGKDKSGQQWKHFLDYLSTLPLSMDPGLRVHLKKAKKELEKIEKLTKKLAGSIREYVSICDDHSIDYPLELDCIENLLLRTQAERKNNLHENCWSWYEERLEDSPENPRSSYFYDSARSGPELSRLLETLSDVAGMHIHEVIDPLNAATIKGNYYAVADYVRSADWSLENYYASLLPDKFTIRHGDLAKILTVLLGFNVTEQNVIMARRRKTEKSNNQ